MSGPRHPRGNGPLALSGDRVARPQLVEPKNDVSGLRFERAALALSHPVALELVYLRLEPCKAPFEQCYECLVAYDLASKINGRRSPKPGRAGRRVRRPSRQEGPPRSKPSRTTPFQRAKSLISESPQAHVNSGRGKARKFPDGAQGLLDLLGL